MDPAMQIEIAAMSKACVLDETAARGDSDVQRFYRRSTLLLTGGTGFMGKQLLEKIFRACDISKVFLLLRPKKGKPIQNRVTEMLQDSCFDKVRKLKPDFSDKIFAIEGDVAEMRLGISDQDWQIIINEVDVIYHMAATTRFDESLRVATLINVRGTREVLQLGRACRKLKSFVHVSTAYTQAVDSLFGQEVFEKFQTSPISPKKLIDLVESEEEGRLERYTDRLLTEYPNTYTFCKAVAEDLVRTMADGLPICIVRPGIVVASYREPTPGWLDPSCAYGASGLLLGAGLGIIHLLFLKRDAKAGFVPCDYVNNAIIVAGKEASSSSGGEQTNIYTITCVARNPVLFGMVPDMGYNNISRSPKAVYYYYVNAIYNRFWFSVLTFFVHMIPAYFADLICLLIGKQRRMVKIYKKVYKMSLALSHFSTNTWIFNDDNLQSLQKSLSKADNTIFNFDVENIDWQEYLQIWVIGVRKYLTKDGLKGTELAKNRQFWFRIAHYTLTALYCYCLWKVFSMVPDMGYNNISRSPKAVYYYYVNAIYNRFWFSVLTFFVHMIPAYFADLICLLIGKERRFPKDNDSRLLWNKATGRKNWEPQKFSRICSKHFHETAVWCRHKIAPPQLFPWVS